MNPNTAALLEELDTLQIELENLASDLASQPSDNNAPLLSELQQLAQTLTDEIDDLATDHADSSLESDSGAPLQDFLTSLKAQLLAWEKDVKQLTQPQ